MKLPALSHHKSLRFLTVTALYVAQGIQFGLMNIAIPTYLAGKGLSAAAIGAFIGAVMIPWSLKILAAPIMDRFTFLAMGRRRPWVLFGIAGASLGYFLMGLVPDPMANFSLFTAMALVVSCFTAFMDVAIDGQAIEIFPIEEQPQANSYMWGGKIIGMALTTAGAAAALSHFGLSVTSFLSAFFCLAFLLFPLLLRERPGERLLPWTKGQAAAESLHVQMEGWGQIVRSLFQVIFLPASLILAGAGFLHGMTYGLFDAIMPVITTQQLGWIDLIYSNTSAFAGLVSGVAGLLFGGLIMKWLGRKWSLIYLLAALAIAAGLMGASAFWWKEMFVVKGFVLVIYLLRTLILITFFATAMAICWKPVAATQFALYMALGNLGISSGAALSGLLSGTLSYPQVLFVFSFLALVAIVLLTRISLKEHVEILEQRSREKGDGQL
jgi:PAT family beta-lactamase induction signal transducer AmpG